MNQIIDEDDNNHEIECIIPGDNNIDNYIDNENKKYLYNKIQEIIKSFKYLEIEVFNYYFGINGYKKLTQYEISSKLNISQAQVSRTIKNSIIKIKNNLTKEDLELWN